MKDQKSSSAASITPNVLICLALDAWIHHLDAEQTFF